MFIKDDIIVFYGDSITESHRRTIALEKSGNTLGNGFVSMVNSYYNEHYPGLNLRIINEGISGNRSIDLIKRLDMDILSYQPNYVFMMIGVNDAWRMFDSPDIKEYIQTNEEFKKNIETLVKKILEHNIKLVILTPFLLVTDKSHPFRKKVDEYGDIIKEVAKENSIDLLDIQLAFDMLLKTNSYELYSHDKIHINDLGNSVIKDEVLKYFKKGDKNGI